MSKVYATSDWHGCGKVARKVLDYLQPDDILYFLGDATDRGKDGVEIFLSLINRPNTFYIKGNHDAMMAEAIPYLYREIEDINYYGGNHYALWYGNGGSVTGQFFWNMSKPDVFAIKAAVDKMPTELKYKSPKGHTVILEHAGYSPFDIPHRSHDPLWDREHFNDNWVMKNDTSEIAKNTYLVHGHTPVQYLKFCYGYAGQPPMTLDEFKVKDAWMCGENIDWKPQIIRYCDGHKFDIDMCTIASNRIALLDLDTFEEIYIDGDEN